MRYSSRDIHGWRWQEIIYGSDSTPGGNVPKSAIKCSVSPGLSFLPSCTALASIRKSTGRFWLTRSLATVGNSETTYNRYSILHDMWKRVNAGPANASEFAGDIHSLFIYKQRSSSRSRLTRSCRHEEFGVLGFGRILECVDGSRRYNH